jgi:hypothetical protein
MILSKYILGFPRGELFSAKHFARPKLAALNEKPALVHRQSKRIIRIGVDDFSEQAMVA